MRPAEELRHLINPRAAYRVRGAAQPVRPTAILARLALAAVLLGLLALVFTRLFAVA